jgi:hypothetical protein
MEHRKLLSLILNSEVISFFLVRPGRIANAPGTKQPGRKHPPIRTGPAWWVMVRSPYV